MTERAGDAVLVEILSMVRSVDSILRSHMHDHDRNYEATEALITAIQADVDKVKSGFPNNDPDGHRAFHLAHIQRVVERAEFWKKMTFELGKYGLIGFSGWLVYALWEAFLKGPK